MRCQPTDRPTTTAHVEPGRLIWSNASGRSPPLGCATAIVVSMCCCVGKGGDRPDAGLPLYRGMGLQLRNKTPKRRVKAKVREDRRSATQPNETWAMDFVHDQLATGRKLRVLTIIDTFSRFSPAIEPRFNFRGPDVVEILEEVGRQMDSRRQSGSIKAQNSSHAISICGLIGAVSRSTSRDRASPLPMPSSNRSMANSERNV